MTPCPVLESSCILFPIHLNPGRVSCLTQTGAHVTPADCQVQCSVRLLITAGPVSPRSGTPRCERRPAGSWRTRWWLTCKPSQCLQDLDDSPSSCRTSTTPAELPARYLWTPSNHTCNKGRYRLSRWVLTWSYCLWDVCLCCVVFCSASQHFLCRYYK